jgi:hypothetical protein
MYIAAPAPVAVMDAAVCGEVVPVLFDETPLKGVVVDVPENCRMYEVANVVPVHEKTAAVSEPVATRHAHTNFHVFEPVSTTVFVSPIVHPELTPTVLVVRIHASASSKLPATMLPGSAAPVAAVEALLYPVPLLT